MGLLAALSIRPFALLWGGQTVSRFGDAVHRVALAWLVLLLTGSAAAMGLVLIVELVPGLVFVLIGGLSVDRFSRVRLMLISDVLRGVVVGVIALLVAIGRVELWHLLVLAAIFGTVSAFFFPAYTAVIPAIVGEGSRPSANSLGELSVQLTRVVGPAVGAALVAAGGTPVAFAIDGLTYAVAAICLVAIARTPGMGRPTPSVDATARARPSVLADLREGFATVLGSTWLWMAIGIAGVSNITLVGPLEAVMPLLVREHLHGDVGLFGLIGTLEAVGSVAAAVWLGRRATLHRRGVVMYGSWIVLALCILAFGLPIGVAGAALASIGIGITNTTLNLIWTNSLQTLVPGGLLGRVSSIDYLGSAGLIPLGYAVAGVAADRIGPAQVFVAGGACGAVIISLALLNPVIRRFD
jgi:DHA3 family tetracycline resistance protein-like MFS transporter